MPMDIPIPPFFSLITHEERPMTDLDVARTTRRKIAAGEMLFPEATDHPAFRAELLRAALQASESIIAGYALGAPLTSIPSDKAP